VTRVHAHYRALEVRAEPSGHGWEHLEVRQEGAPVWRDPDELGITNEAPLYEALRRAQDEAAYEDACDRARERRDELRLLAHRED